MKPYLYPYQLSSVSANLLAKALDTIRIREAGTFVHNAAKLVVNWGSSRHGNLKKQFPHLNHPDKVAVAINKLYTFKEFEAADFKYIPKWTTSKEQVANWLNDGYVVIARTALRSSQGRGIEIVKPGATSIPNAPLYTRLFPKDKEYRVHVFRGSVIDFVQKKLKTGFTPKPYIRSHDNGWVFCREGVELPNKVREVAIEAIKALKLDFGAVDLAISKNGKVCVFEVNTAPGIEGTTVVNYAKAIKTYTQQLEQNAPNNVGTH